MSENKKVLKLMKEVEEWKRNCYKLKKQVEKQRKTIDEQNKTIKRLNESLRKEQPQKEEKKEYEVVVVGKKIKKKRKKKKHDLEFDKFERVPYDKFRLIPEKIDEEYDYRNQPSRSINHEYFRKGIIKMDMTDFETSDPQNKEEFEEACEKFKQKFGKYDFLFRRGDIRSYDEARVGYEKIRLLMHFLLAGKEHTERINGVESSVGEDVKPPPKKKKKKKRKRKKGVSPQERRFDFNSHEHLIQVYMDSLLRLSVCYYHFENYEKSLEYCDLMMDIVSQPQKHGHKELDNYRDFTYYQITNVTISQKEYSKAKMNSSNVVNDTLRNELEVLIERSRDFGEDLYTSRFDPALTKKRKKRIETWNPRYFIDQNIAREKIWTPKSKYRSKIINPSRFKTFMKKKLKKRKKNQNTYNYTKVEVEDINSINEIMKNGTCIYAAYYDAVNSFSIDHFKKCCEEAENTLVIAKPKQHGMVIGFYNHNQHWTFQKEKEEEERLRGEEGSFIFAANSQGYDPMKKPILTVDVIRPKLRAGFVALCTEHSFGFSSGYNDGVYFRRTRFGESVGKCCTRKNFSKSLSSHANVSAFGNVSSSTGSFGVHSIEVYVPSEKFVLRKKQEEDERRAKRKLMENKQKLVMKEEEEDEGEETDSDESSSCYDDEEEQRVLSTDDSSSDDDDSSDNE